jgi:predicted phage-related endonuclease
LGDIVAIKVTPITSAEQWQAMRRKNVGCSEVAALFGIHDYLTGFALAARKLGKLPDVIDNKILQRGRLLEPVARQLLAEERQDLVQIAAGSYYADEEIRFGATPDLFVKDELGRVGICQIKTVAPSVFARKWHGDAGTVVPPLWIALQAMSEMHLTGSEFAVIAALVVDDWGLSLEVVEVPYLPKVIAEAREKVFMFWQMIDMGHLPAPDYGQDYRTITKVFAEDDGGEIDLTSDNELPEIVDQLQALKHARSTAEDGIEEAQAKILHRLGNAAKARYAGGVITAKTEHRKAYQVAESTRRPLRIKQERERAA